MIPSHAIFARSGRSISLSYAVRRLHSVDSKAPRRRVLEMIDHVTRDGEIRCLLVVDKVHQTIKSIRSALMLRLRRTMRRCWNLVGVVGYPVVAYRVKRANKTQRRGGRELIS